LLYLTRNYKSIARAESRRLPISPRCRPATSSPPGTPEGVGHSRKPPLWMNAGDTLEVEITILRARIVGERT
jgi:hypothetical protein